MTLNENDQIAPEDTVQEELKIIPVSQEHSASQIMVSEFERIYYGNYWHSAYTISLTWYDSNATQIYYIHSHVMQRIYYLRNSVRDDQRSQQKPWTWGNPDLFWEN